MVGIAAFLLFTLAVPGQVSQQLQTSTKEIALEQGAFIHGGTARS
jgi:hypothetical protein